MTFSFESKDDIRKRCISYLLVFLAKHEPFVQRLHEIGANHPKMVLKPFSEILELKLVGYTAPFDEHSCEATGSYYEKLLALVMEYGLNPDWALEPIHRAGKNINVLFTGMNLSDIPIERKFNIEWSFDVESLPTKKQIESDMLKQFERQWEGLEQELGQYGFSRTRRRRSFKDHMRWVFKHVCLKKSWNQIAKEERFTADTIRKAVYPIVKQLGLQSPQLRGGRPRK